MCETLQEKLHKKPCVTEPKPELPSNFDLLDFDTEDDEMLKKFLNANQEILDGIQQPEETAVATPPANPVPAVPVCTKTPHEIQMDMHQNIHNFPVVPKMYFPGSHITINYNFGTGPQ